MECERPTALVEELRAVVLVELLPLSAVLVRANLRRTAPERRAKGRAHRRAHKEVRRVQVVLLRELVIVLVLEDKLDALGFGNVRADVDAGAVERGGRASCAQHRRQAHPDRV